MRLRSSECSTASCHESEASMSVSSGVMFGRRYSKATDFTTPLVVWLTLG